MSSDKNGHYNSQISRLFFKTGFPLDIISIRQASGEGTHSSKTVAQPPTEFMYKPQGGFKFTQNLTSHQSDFDRTVEDILFRMAVAFDDAVKGGPNNGGVARQKSHAVLYATKDAFEYNSGFSPFAQKACDLFAKAKRVFATKNLKNVEKKISMQEAVDEVLAGQQTAKIRSY